MCRRLQPYASQAIHQLLEGGAHVNAADTSGVLPIGFAETGIHEKMASELKAALKNR